MYILAVIVALITFGIVIDLKKGNFKDRIPHDTNSNNIKLDSSADNAFNSSDGQQHIP